MKNGGFEVVLMNPPYIKEDENREAFSAVKSNPIYQGKMDLWYLFGGLALDLIQPETGLIGIIAQSNWVTSDGAQKFRNKVIRDGRIERFVDFGSYNVFEDAGIQTMIMICRRSSADPSYDFSYQKFEVTNGRESDVIDFLTQDDTQGSLRFSTQLDRASSIGETISFVPPTATRVIDAISSKGSFFLDPKSEIFSGIDGQETVKRKDAERLSQALSRRIEPGDGIFVLTRAQLAAKKFSSKDMELIRPLFSPSEINRFYAIREPAEYVIYTGPVFKDPKSLDAYPGIKKHLDLFQDVITSANKPYGLHRARDPEIYSGERIFVIRKAVGRPRFSLIDFEAYFTRTFNVIKTDRIDNMFLTCVLNSSLIAYWFKFRGKMQGDNYQIDMRPLGAVPIAQTDEVEPFRELHEKLCEAHSNFQEAKSKFWLPLRTLYSLQSVPRSLSAWWEIDFQEFHQKLNLQLTPTQVSDLNDYFTSRSRDIRKLIAEIQVLEYDLDELVFDLYEIDSDDRQIVRATVTPAHEL
nr:MULTISPECIES: Eco57I restriction-modification methylase domain-containing protein [unclassified Corynebacterium]